MRSDCLRAGLACAALLVCSTPAVRADEVRLNQIQVIGTHNSYHAGLTPGIQQLLGAKGSDVVRNWDYQHRELDRQLSAGIRQVELDIYADSQGGRFAHPKGMDWAASAGLEAVPPADSPAVMEKPGFKVLHVQDLDYRSNCQPLAACLTVIRNWSKSHPKHAPIFILIETKLDRPKSSFDFTEPEPFTSQTFDALDAEIRAVFPHNALIVPDQVRGKFATLQEAVHAGHWPKLSEARGKVLFLMDQQRVGPVYLEGHPSLRGRVIFTNARPGEPDAAFVEQNEADVASINSLVREGYLVRARTDWDTKQARSNDTGRRNELLASGAQLLSSDYPASEPARWTGYSVSFPENVAARCNPVVAPRQCRSDSLDPYRPEITP
jgi:Phosphoinositide phospholipase C, Ca2+-dependent